MSDDTAPTDIAAVLGSLTSRAQAADEERRSLPCFDGVEAGDDERAAEDCAAEGTYVTCRWLDTPAVCPRKRLGELHETVLANLRAAPISPVNLRVPAREAEVITAATQRAHRVPLRDLDSLQVARAVLTRSRCAVRTDDALELRFEVDPTTGVRTATKHAGSVRLTGSEVLIGFGGNQGRGKTLAACYAIARLGGIYTRAPQWTRLGDIDVNLAIKAPVLVVDQFGREHFGDSAWSLSQFEDAVDARYQARRVTLLVGNVSWEQFAERLARTTLVDRIKDDGVFIEFRGESIRADLRASRLESDDELSRRRKGQHG